MLTWSQSSKYWKYSNEYSNERNQKNSLPLGAYILVNIKWPLFFVNVIYIRRYFKIIFNE